MATDRHPLTRAAALLVAGALILALSSVAAAQIDIQHWETDNGARVYFVAAPELPMVDVQIVFDAGSARDATRPGLARLTSRLLDQGAGTMDADAVAAHLEGLGAQLGTESHRDMAVVNLRSLSEPTLLEPALDTLAAILRSPTFAPAAIERERGRMLTALRAERQSPGEIATRTFYNAVYGDHAYGIHPAGSAESVQALSREDIERFHGRYYVARNAVVAIVGAVDRAGAAAIAERLMGDLPAGEPAAALPEVTALEREERIDVRFPSTQTHIVAGQPGLRRHDPDYFPLYVGNHVLGGSGLVSIISEEIRESRGLAYSSYSYFSPMRAEGPFLLGLQTRNDQAEGAIGVLFETVERFIEEGPGPERLAASKKNITGGFALRIASNRDIVGNLAVIGFYGLPLDYLDTFNDRVEAVTAGQVRDAFARRIDPDAMVVVTVGQSAE